MGATTVGRSLKTARAVLHVLKEMESCRDGLTTERVAELTGKSEATATYLLNSLVVEGFACRVDGNLYCPTNPDDYVPDSGAELERATRTLLADTGQALYQRSGERAYVGRRKGESVAIHDTWGRQGQPLVPGLDAGVSSAAHALAIGKALFAHDRAELVDEYVSIRGLTRFTPSTITDRAALADDLEATVERGVAVNAEEFAVGFVGLAAPVIGPCNDVAGIVGISLTRHKFDTNGDSLIAVVKHVAQRASARLDEVVGSLVMLPPAHSTNRHTPPRPHHSDIHNRGETDVREER